MNIEVQIVGVTGGDLLDVKFAVVDADYEYEEIHRHFKQGTRFRLIPSELFKQFVIERVRVEEGGE